MAAQGVWVAHPLTVGSAAQVAVFSSEVAALREAVREGWQVTFVPFGSTVAAAVQGSGS